MPTFDDHARSAAPVEQVWKLLHDPSRLPDWWTGRPTQLRTDRRDGAVTMSCVQSDMRFDWRLDLADDGRATDIAVHVDIPDRHADLLTTQREAVHRAVHALARLAEHSL